MIHDFLLAPFVDLPFMRRALVGGMAVSLGAAPIGVLLMLRRMSLMGDAIAHAILPGAALGFLIGGLSLGAMTLGGLIAGFGVTLLAGLVARSTLVKEDMALAAFYVVSLAIGVLILSRGGANVDVLGLLFGSILALDDPTLLFLVTVASLTTATLALGYRGFLLECLDPGFAAGISRHGALFHYGFLALVVLNLVAGFHALGTLLVLGIMIIPAGTARLWCDDAGPMLGVAMATALVANVVGLLASFHLGLSSGPAIIVAAGMIYLASLLLGPHGLFGGRAAARHLEA